MRERILEEIVRLAKTNGGRAPGRAAFEKETGIRYKEWFGIYWTRWGDALAEAGLPPNDLQTRIDEDLMLRKLAEACRHFGKVPTVGELRMYSRIAISFPSHSTFSNHFATKADLIAGLSAWVQKHEEFSDVRALLTNEQVPRVKLSVDRTQESWVYLLQSGDNFKIGRSEDVERRIKQINIAMPEKVVLVHSIKTDDSAGIEAYWHRRFATRRKNGEWFQLTANDVMAFKRRRIQ